MFISCWEWFEYLRTGGAVHCTVSLLVHALPPKSSEHEGGAEIKVICAKKPQRGISSFRKRKKKHGPLGEFSVLHVGSNPIQIQSVEVFED